MRGREYQQAVAALDKVAGLGHFRTETLRRAVASVLAYLGAARIVAAADGDPARAEDRRVLLLCAEAEGLADVLDRLPQRGGHSEARRACWEEIVAVTAKIKLRLLLERRLRGGKCLYDDGRKKGLPWPGGIGR